MPAAQQFAKVGEVYRQVFEMGDIGHDAKRAQNIVGVFWPFVWNDAVKDDLRGFLDAELGALDEV